MLQTPPTFTPLIQPQIHFNTMTLVFHRDRLLLRDADGTPAPPAVTGALAIAPERVHAIGLWDDCYYQAAWVDDDAPPAGYSYHGLRSLFGRLDDHLLGLVGRAAQIVEWARPPLLRRLRHAHRAGGRGTLRPLSAVRDDGLSAHFAGDDGADPQGRRRLAGHAQRLAVSALHGAGRLPRGRRIDRGSRAPRGLRGGRPARAQAPIFQQPVVALPACADDR